MKRSRAIVLTLTRIEAQALIDTVTDCAMPAARRVAERLSREVESTGEAVNVRTKREGTADGTGKRTWFVKWEEPQGYWRPELGRDGEPVGYRRGQVFRCTEERLREIVKGVVVS